MYADRIQTQHHDTFASVGCIPCKLYGLCKQIQSFDGSTRQCLNLLAQCEGVLQPKTIFQDISGEDIWPSGCFLMVTFQTHHPSNLHSLNLQSSVSFCLVCRCSCQAPVLRLAGTVSQRCQGHVGSRIGSLTGSEGVGLKIRANDVNEVTKASQQYQCDPFQA